MDKNAIRDFAVSARQNLVESVTRRAKEYGITDENADVNTTQDAMGREMSKDTIRQRRDFLRLVKEEIL